MLRHLPVLRDKLAVTSSCRNARAASQTDLAWPTVSLGGLESEGIILRQYQTCPVSVASGKFRKVQATCVPGRFLRLLQYVQGFSPCLVVEQKDSVVHMCTVE